MPNLVTLDDVRVIRVTDRAVLLTQGDDREVWVPRSVCEDGDSLDVGDTDICVSRWFAEREELSF